MQYNFVTQCHVPWRCAIIHSQYPFDENPWCEASCPFRLTLKCVQIFSHTDKHGEFVQRIFDDGESHGASFDSFNFSVADIYDESQSKAAFSDHLW